MRGSASAGMPGAGVAHRRDDPIAAGGSDVVDLDAAGAAGRRDRVLGVHHHVQEHLVKQQRIALHARQLLVIVSHDFDVRGAARVRRAAPALSAGRRSG